ncbi:MAG: DUF423 domain-containing protein [Alphaproteobacteria bacterium]|nr:DUF423 domain-containing protein [Alphaproteobacteria bacterium]
MMARVWIVLACASAALSLVVAAQFQHGVAEAPALAQRLTFDVANDIHMMHALALLAIGILTSVFGNRTLVHLAGISFALGTIFFSGGIYASFNPDRAAEIGRLIPVGGFLLIAGWVILAASVVTLDPPRR